MPVADEQKRSTGSISTARRDRSIALHWHFNYSVYEPAERQGISLQSEVCRGRLARLEWNHEPSGICHGGNCFDNSCGGGCLDAMGDIQKVKHIMSPSGFLAALSPISSFFRRLA